LRGCAGCRACMDISRGRATFDQNSRQNPPCMGGGFCGIRYLTVKWFAACWAGITSIVSNLFAKRGPLSKLPS
jgi:hypothetical protein